MRVAVTGTPGTGKTTATELLEGDRNEHGDGENDTETDTDDEFEIGSGVIHLNDVIREEGLYTDTDVERDSLVVDLDRVADWLDEREGVGVLIVESHLAHHFSAERVVVLRCHPETLEERLREREESDTKATENAEAEALDVILTEAVDKHGEENVYEIDATDKSPETVARDIKSVIEGGREPGAGGVNFVDYL